MILHFTGMALNWNILREDWKWRIFSNFQQKQQQKKNKKLKFEANLLLQPNDMLFTRMALNWKVLHEEPFHTRISETFSKNKKENTKKDRTRELLQYPVLCVNISKTLQLFIKDSHHFSSKNTPILTKLYDPKMTLSTKRAHPILWVVRKEQLLWETLSLLLGPSVGPCFVMDRFSCARESM